MTRKDSSDDAGIPRIGSPIMAGLILLCIYIAMYLAVAGVVHVLTSPGAAAVAANSSMAPASAATAENRAVKASDSPSRHNSEPSADRYLIQRAD